MRSLLPITLLAAVGCQGPHHFGHEPWTSGCDGTPCASSCAPSCPAPQPQQAPQPVRAAPAESKPAIAQEVMLVPRTVYVPFVAQTPLAPVRLSALGAGAAPAPEPAPSTAAPQPQQAPPQPERLPQPQQAPPVCQAPGPDLADLLGKLNARLDRLEAQLARPAMEPCPCPTPCPGPCPMPPCPQPTRRLLPFGSPSECDPPCPR
jgi:hypothetical protein